MENQVVEVYLDKPVLTVLSHKITYLYLGPNFEWFITDLNSIKTYKNPLLIQPTWGKEVESSNSVWHKIAINMLYLSLSTAIIKHDRILYSDWKKQFSTEQIQSFIESILVHQYNLPVNTNENLIEKMDKIINPIETDSVYCNLIETATRQTGYNTNDGTEVLYTNLDNPFRFLLATYKIKTLNCYFYKEQLYYNIDISYLSEYCIEKPLFINMLRDVAAQYAHLVLLYNLSTEFNFTLNMDSIRKINQRTCKYLGLA